MAFAVYVLALDLNLDVQLFRNLASSTLTALASTRAQAFSSCSEVDAIDDLQLLFRLRNDGADGHRILDAD